MIATITAFWASIPRTAKLIGGAVIITLIALTLVYCTGRKTGEATVQHQIDTGNIKALGTNANAVSNAADDRTISDTQLLEQKKELIDAVNKTPDTLPSPARIALGCERLRRQGTSTAAIPACNGS